MSGLEYNKLPSKDTLDRHKIMDYEKLEIFALSALIEILRALLRDPTRF